MMSAQAAAYRSQPVKLAKPDWQASCWMIGDVLGSHNSRLFNRDTAIELLEIQTPWVTRAPDPAMAAREAAIAERSGSLEADYEGESDGFEAAEQEEGGSVAGFCQIKPRRGLTIRVYTDDDAIEDALAEEEAELDRQAGAWYLGPLKLSSLPQKRLAEARFAGAGVSDRLDQGDGIAHGNLERRERDSKLIERLLDNATALFINTDADESGAMLYAILTPINATLTRINAISTLR